MHACFYNIQRAEVITVPTKISGEVETTTEIEAADLKTTTRTEVAMVVTTVATEMEVGVLRTTTETDEVATDMATGIGMGIDMGTGGCSLPISVLINSSEHVLKVHGPIFQNLVFCFI